MKARVFQKHVLGPTVTICTGDALADAQMLAEQFDVHPKTIYDIATGRSHNPKVRKKGEVYYSSKLNMLQARRIRDLYSYGCHTLSSLALMYGVSFPTIHRVVKNKCYVE